MINNSNYLDARGILKIDYMKKNLVKEEEIVKRLKELFSVIEESKNLESIEDMFTSVDDSTKLKENLRVTIFS